MIAVLLTGHFYAQRRRTSMHWLADELAARGWSVRFVTVGISRLSRLLGDQRIVGADALDEGTTWPAPRIEAIFHRTAFHPLAFRNRLLDRASAPSAALFRRLWRRSLAKALRDADLVVVESGLPLLLAPLVKRLSAARLVYRVNDDVRVLRVPEVLRRRELDYAALFDRVSLASPVLARRFAHLGTVGIDPMGLDRSALAETMPCPFGERWEREAVSSGSSHFDTRSVGIMAQLRPTWRFHVFGRLKATLSGPNIVCHGETAFREVMPYVRHADVGLAPYLPRPGVEYQTHHSNRLLQYAHVGLPTVGPIAMVHDDAPYLVGYLPGDRPSIDAALDRVIRLDRAVIRQDPPGWAAMCDGIVGSRPS